MENNQIFNNNNGYPRILYQPRKYSTLMTNVRGCVDILNYGENIPIPKKGKTLSIFHFSPREKNIMYLFPLRGKLFLFIYVFIFIPHKKGYTKYYLCHKKRNYFLSEGETIKTTSRIILSRKGLK